MIRIGTSGWHYNHWRGPEKFFDHVAGLGRKLGPILWQFPPRWQSNPQRLAEFLAVVPRRVRHAFELRDPSWFNDEVNAVLRKYKAAFCIYDFDRRTDRRASTPAAIATGRYRTGRTSSGAGTGKEGRLLLLRQRSGRVCCEGRAAVESAAMTESVREARKRRGFQNELAEKGWYHSFRLPDGSLIEGYNDIDYLERRWVSFPIPADLRGKRVLDIGTWDGYFAFTAEQHGAEVTAVDYVEQPNFLWLHRRLGSRVEYRILDVFELPQAGLGAFDVVFFLGILYHLKHPLLALEIVCAHTRETAIVESFVIDGDTWEQHRDDIPVMEFYETDELGGQLDNWIGPSVGCLLALCRAAGFARVELIRVSGSDAMVACHRCWEPPASEAPGPELVAVDNNITGGINFTTRKDDYVAAWFKTDRVAVAREDLRFEIDGLGVPALWCGRYEAGWSANFRLPPGLTPGWKEARLRFADTGFSGPHRIAVDLPLRVERLEVRTVCDGLSWTEGEVRTHLTCWVHGLPENADRANVLLMLGETRLKVDYVGAADVNGWRQINARVSAPPGAARLVVSCAGVEAAPAQVVVVSA